jgi:hypothetical protein
MFTKALVIVAVVVGAGVYVGHVAVSSVQAALGQHLQAVQQATQR